MLGMYAIFFVENWPRREKSVSRNSVSTHLGAKLAEVAELQDLDYFGQAQDLFTQKRVQLVLKDDREVSSLWERDSPKKDVKGHAQGLYIIYN